MFGKPKTEVNYKKERLTQVLQTQKENINFSQKDLKVFPNPTSDVIHCSATFPIERIAIFDVFGRKIMETDEDSINLSGLAKGLYILEINHNIQRKIEKR